MPDSLPLLSPARRQFLAQASFGIAAAGILASTSSPILAQPPKPASQPAPQADATGNKIGWAIAGLGKFAIEQILPNIRHCTKTRVAGFITRDPQGKGREYASRYGVDTKAVFAPDNVRALADNKDIQVVYVITPNATHKDYVLAALEAGKHVLCEKPFAPTVQDCQQMIDAAKKADRKIMIAYRSHFQPHNLAAIDAIRKGTLGTLRMITWENIRILDLKDPSDQWRAQQQLSGGGSLVDIGVYCLNGARYLTSEEPIQVTAQDATPRHGKRLGDIEEQIAFQLHFPSGVVASCVSGYIAQHGNRARAYGDKGVLDLDPATSYQGQKLFLQTAGGKREEQKIEEGNQFAAMMDHFSDCLLTGKEPKIPAEEGLRDVRYMTAIYESARNNGAAVEIS